MRDWNGPNTDLFFSSSSLFVCNPIQPNVDDLAVLVFPQKPSSTLGVFLCPVLVTMCTGGSPGVAGTSGGSQRLPAGWTHTEKPVMLHGTTQSGVCRNVIVFAHNSVRVDLWHRSTFMWICLLRCTWHQNGKTSASISSIASKDFERK